MRLRFRFITVPFKEEKGKGETSNLFRYKDVHIKLMKTILFFAFVKFLRFLPTIKTHSILIPRHKTPHKFLIKCSSGAKIAATPWASTQH